MKVRFKREGGFAGMTVRREAELHELPHDARRALYALENMSGPEAGNASTKRRDGFLYTIELEKDTDPLVVSIDEQNVTKEIAPLIRYFEVR